jgi:hypothetical protein
MADDQVGELTAYQRAARVTLRLAEGATLRTEEVMALTGLRRSGALKLLGQLAQMHDLPVYECRRGVWQMMKWKDGCSE